MIRRPPRSTQSRSSAASDVYKRQGQPSSAVTITVSTPSAAAEHHFRTDKLTNTVSDLVHGPCYAEQNVRGDISPPTLAASSSQCSPKSSPTLTCQPARPGPSSPLLGGLTSSPSENLKGKALKGTVMSSRSPKASGMLFSAFSLCQSVLFTQGRLCSTCNRSPLTI